MRIITMTTKTKFIKNKNKLYIYIYIAQERYQLLKTKINKNYIHNKRTWKIITIPKDEHLLLCWCMWELEDSSVFFIYLKYASYFVDTYTIPMGNYSNSTTIYLFISYQILFIFWINNKTKAATAHHYGLFFF